MSNITTVGLTLTAAYLGATIGNRGMDWYSSKEENPESKELYKNIGYLGGGIICALAFLGADHKYALSAKVSQFLVQKMDQCIKKAAELYYSIYLTWKAKRFAYDSSNNWTGNNQAIYEYIKNVINNAEFRKNPQQYLMDWTIRRGRTREFRIPEDMARSFFYQYFPSKP